MKYKILASAVLTLLCFQPVAAQDVDYTKGVFIVNEDWYGHQNSTVNYLLPDAEDGNYWHYRVIQTENPGTELGCTNQYGAIYNGRFYFIAKQDKDPGATIAGGRITVSDAKTMKVLYQSAVIDPSGATCDGRAFIGVDENKGYISSSNGVWIFDLNTFEVKGKIKGTENPNEDTGGNPSNPGGSLYHGQTGSMVMSGGLVFVAHQQYGVLVVDPQKDEVVQTIPVTIVAEGAGVGSVVKSKDGMIWASVAANVSGTGATLANLVKIDPVTLDTEVIDLPENIEAPANSWYAWTPDGFCASAQNNCLYWNGGESSWFSGYRIFKYDIDSGEISKIIDLQEDGDSWQLYGCSMRVHPKTDEIYMSLYHQFSDPTFIARRYSSDGEKINDYPMIQNYWFPSLPVFPEETGDTGVSENTARCNNDMIISLSEGKLFISNVTGNQVFVYSVSGCLVKSASVADGICFINMTDLSAGVYIVRTANAARKIILK